MESVKSQSLNDNMVNNNMKDPSLSAIARHHLDTVIPRVFQSSRRELMTHKMGKELPRGFEFFVTTPLCHDMCGSILDYVKYLIKLDKKK